VGQERPPDDDEPAEDVDGRLADDAIEATARVDPVPDDVVAAAEAVFRERSTRGARRRPPGRTP
jgi:hypothetical protein